MESDPDPTHPNPQQKHRPPGQSPVDLSDFGANEWLVEELYEKYLRDKNSVDRSWWDALERLRRSNGRGPATAATKPLAHGSAHRLAAPPPQPAGRSRAPGRHRGPDPDPQQNTISMNSPPRVDLSDEKPAGAEHQGHNLRHIPPRPDARRRIPLQEPPKLDRGAEPSSIKLRGPAARVVTNMQTSLELPTATSVRTVPAKLLVDNRIVINSNLARARGGKVSFTHIIGYAVVEALAAMPHLNYHFGQTEDGKPAVIDPGQVGLGIAIDLAKDDGSRQLLVPAVRNAEQMEFREFWTAYEDVVRRARAGKLQLEDFTSVTLTLTNPGTIGTVHSVPRLMKDQGCIIGIGAMEYPAEYAGASEKTLAELAVSKVMTLTSTYDHRIIQGAVSGQFLKLIHQKLLGEDGFYDRIFRSLRIPYEPVRWVRDAIFAGQDEINKTARVVELIHAYRVRGHLMADTDPLEYRQRKHQDLDIQSYGLSLWDLERDFPVGDLSAGRVPPVLKLRDILKVLRDSYCRTIGIEYMHIQDPEQRRWIQARVERA
ncbi:MAG: multifunctional oxoglutarate decarboxylase/oxoglutarate dehydrogenase thiamine pyrophosphate-binding subunit/dihydrolipoyllysine-residue succinyltransferase subunit, partial [Micrococcales bacterium]